MRLFTAIPFSEHCKHHFAGVIEQLSRQSTGGRFTREDNLHLTLVFLGETDRVKEIITAMQTVKSAPFSLTFAQFGRFRRDGGDIYWMAPQKSPQLFTLQSALASAFLRAGFSLENRAYRPHVTLGRQVVLPETFSPASFSESAPEITAAVDRVSLMKSERLHGRLVYHEIYGRQLEEER